MYYIGIDNTDKESQTVIGAMIEISAKGLNAFLPHFLFTVIPEEKKPLLTIGGTIYEENP